ncbi:MAG: calcium/sodium antiporter [Clostridiales bacterium]|nr:calcium/sodium antiporter [Clostridiales bacterium]MCD7827022.1 calcium/sodium antiporter [Clostridiales bacterium]
MDNIIVQIIIMIASIAAVVKGGDIFVDAASWMAEATGIPKLIVGATVVSIATTLPEMFVSAIAAYGGSGDMAIGNAVGSVTANIGLIMALALICMPSVVDRKDYMLKSLLMLGASVVIIAAGFSGELNILGSLALLAICAVAWADNIRSAKHAVSLSHMSKAEGAPAYTPKTDGGEAAVVKDEIQGKEIAKNVVLFIVGAAAIAVGANFMVSSGQFIAEYIGIPERVIAVTVIAIGTSLPELVTTITAIVKKEMSLSVGNIIGANILDMTLILPVCSLISNIKYDTPLEFSDTVAAIDLPILLIVGLIVVVPMLITKKFSRAQGVALIAVYAVYLVVSTVPSVQALIPWLA